MRLRSSKLGQPKLSDINKAVNYLRYLGPNANVFIPGAIQYTYGPELVVNGSFSSSAGWVLAASGTAVGPTISNSQVHFNSASSDYTYARRTDLPTLTIGQTYSISVDCTSWTSGTFQVALLGGTVTVPIPVINSTGKKTVNFVATAANTGIEISRISGTNFVASFDNISVKEVLTVAPAVLDGMTAANYLMSDGSTGLAPVDQPIGRLNDAMGVVGPELIANGTFDTAAGWGITQPTSGSVAISGGVLRVASEDGSFAVAVNTVATIVSGKTYKVEFDVIAYTGTAGVTFNGPAAFNITAGVGRKTMILSADGTMVGIKRIGVCDITIDNFSCKEITGIHATQGTTANKPILRRGTLNQFPNSEMVGAAVGVLGAGGAIPPGWTWGIVAGMTREVVALGTLPSGEKYIDLRLSGTNTSGGTAYPDIYFLAASAGASAAQGSTFTASCKLQRIAGSNAGFAGGGNERRVNIVYNTSAGGYVESANGAPAANPTSLVRSIATGTAVGATVARVSGYISLPLAAGATVDLTLRIAQPQLEFGGTATDYVPTSGTIASNPSAGPYWWQFDGVNDSLSLGGPLFQMADDHCVVAAAASTAATGDRYLLDHGNSASSNAMVSSLALNGTLAKVYWRDDALVTIALNGGSLAQGSTGVLSARKVAAAGVLRLNGQQVAAGAISAGATTLTGAAIGVRVFPANFLAGQIFPVIAIKGTVPDDKLLLLEKLVAHLSGVTL